MQYLLSLGKLNIWLHFRHHLYTKKDWDKTVATFLNLETTNCLLISLLHPQLLVYFIDSPALEHYLFKSNLFFFEWHCKLVFCISPLLWNWKDGCWSWNSDTEATWYEQPPHIDWRLKEKRVTKDETDGWMKSPIQWTWTWANSGRWRGTGRHGVLQPMGLQRVGLTWQLNSNTNHCEKDIVDEMCDPLEFNGKRA